VFCFVLLCFVLFCFICFYIYLYIYFCFYFCFGFINQNALSLAAQMGKPVDVTTLDDYSLTVYGFRQPAVFIDFISYKVCLDFAVPLNFLTCSSLHLSLSPRSPVSSLSCLLALLLFLLSPFPSLMSGVQHVEFGMWGRGSFLWAYGAKLADNAVGCGWPGYEGNVRGERGREAGRKKRIKREWNNEQMQVKGEGREILMQCSDANLMQDVVIVGETDNVGTFNIQVGKYANYWGDEEGRTRFPFALFLCSFLFS
jgi:hypothetical protein